MKCLDCFFFKKNSQAYLPKIFLGVCFCYFIFELKTLIKRFVESNWVYETCHGFNKLIRSIQTIFLFNAFYAPLFLRKKNTILSFVINDVLLLSRHHMPITIFLHLKKYLIQKNYHVFYRSVIKRKINS